MPMTKSIFHGACRAPAALKTAQQFVMACLFLAISGLGLSGPAFAQSSGENTPARQDLTDAIVRVDTVIPADARTANSLGQERSGSGVLIDSTGLVLTIGYIMMESEGVTVTFKDGTVFPASFVAYDHESGFGLLRTLKAPSVSPVRLGESSSLQRGDVLAAMTAQAGDSVGVDVTPVRVVSTRTFAGYWEYLLEGAIFTAPPVRMFGGAALMDQDGRLVGVGSLIVNDAAGPNRPPLPGNMYIPIDALKPILADLLDAGRRQGRQSPWIGVITEEYRGHVFVVRASEDGPARGAGIRAGDLLTAVNGEAFFGMEGFLRLVKQSGTAGSTIDLDVVTPGTGAKRVAVTSMDRHNWLRLKPGN